MSATQTVSSNDAIVEDIKKLVRIETWRNSDGSNEQEVKENLGLIKALFTAKMDTFNKDHKMKINQFEWKDKTDKYWVFGFRAGNGKRKISLICHLDTVPPGDGWDAFNPRLETRIYKGVPTTFLIGRGALDDKGPAVVAFDSFIRALDKADQDQTGHVLQMLADEVTLEVLFDTSEETDMSTPVYFGQNPDEVSALGIVFDSLWSVRAEKGIERTVVTISPTTPAPLDTLSIKHLTTSSGSINMIPVSAEAHITGPESLLKNFKANVHEWYRTCPFDGPDYHPASLIVSAKNGHIVLTTKVAGAQHGSAPNQNRANGANPLVSMTNFLAYLLDRDILVNNHNGEMCRFIRWAFGTRVFGENHPDLLSRYDTVFGEGNGTTYGLTQLAYNNHGEICLGIDIRYAIGHHSRGWDGCEGQVAGDSLFQSVFTQLVNRYTSEMGGSQVKFDTQTVFGPDIRSLRDADLFKINIAYRSIMGENCPMLAIGGATDAHGRLGLVTAGPLFTDNLGPPVNYHGIDEGAPLIDLQNSGQILLHFLTQELAISDHDSFQKIHYTSYGGGN